MIQLGYLGYQQWQRQHFNVCVLSSEFTKVIKAEIDGWSVAGASKRGWTTWMVGSKGTCESCPNIMGIAPISPDCS